MKNIPIKFRAQEIIKDGEYIYGDYVTRTNGAAIRVRENNKLFNLHEYEIAVRPETVAQLVGYDVDRKEVYEGDTLIDDDGNTATAEIYSNVPLKEYRLYAKENER